jgi:ElaB/YqjD/DUF883 family membrane-anchored ribosome-binding protein
MADKKASNAKLNDALRMANEAVIEMGTGTKIAITEDLTALQSALAGTHAGQKILEAKDYSVEKVKEFGAKMDESVHEKPYHFVAGAALAGLLVGALLGRKS